MSIEVLKRRLDQLECELARSQTAATRWRGTAVLVLAFAAVMLIGGTGKDQPEDAFLKKLQQVFQFDDKTGDLRIPKGFSAGPISVDVLITPEVKIFKRLEGRAISIQTDGKEAKIEFMNSQKRIVPDESGKSFDLRNQLVLSADASQSSVVAFGPQGDGKLMAHLQVTKERAEVETSALNQHRASIVTIPELSAVGVKSNAGQSGGILGGPEGGPMLTLEAPGKTEVSMVPSAKK